ncbi:hypothetical protein Tco_1158590 [Tanacetum coccineum]
MMEPTIEEHMKKVRHEYIENEKFYAEAIILINWKFVKLIDVSPEQWLDLMYGNHRTMDPHVKWSVIGTWLIRSYKQQMTTWPPNEKEMCISAIMTLNTIRTIRGDDEVVLTDDEDSIPEIHDDLDEAKLGEIFGIDVDLFHYETPLCMAFNEFNYLLKIEEDLFTYEIPKLKDFNENPWMERRNLETPWVDEKPWNDWGLNLTTLFIFANHSVSTMGKLNGPHVIRILMDRDWYDNLVDGDLKTEALRKKIVYEKLWGNAAIGVTRFCAWLKRCFGDFHELEPSLLTKLSDYWWKKIMTRMPPLFNWSDHLPKGPYANAYSRAENPWKKWNDNKVKPKDLGSNPQNNTGNTYDEALREENVGNNNVNPINLDQGKPPLCTIRRFEIIKYSFGSTE